MARSFTTEGVELVSSEDPPYFQQVVEGNVPGRTGIHIHGVQSVATTSELDVWGVAAAHTFNTANQSMEVLGNVNDVLTTGTGAWTVFVKGQNIAGTEQSETVNMNGTTPVALVNTYSHVYEAYVVTAGSLGTNSGDITIQIASGGAIAARIGATLGETRMAIYRIPAGKTGYLYQWAVGLQNTVNTQRVRCNLRMRKSGEAWLYKGWQSFSILGSSTSTIKYVMPQPISALTEIVVGCKSTAINTGVFSILDILLVDD
jgi:hypothetical protein